MCSALSPAMAVCLSLLFGKVEACNDIFFFFVFLYFCICISFVLFVVVVAVLLHTQLNVVFKWESYVLIKPVEADLI